MLTRLDRILLVVPDRAEAAERFAALFGARRLAEDGSAVLSAPDDPPGRRIPHRTADAHRPRPRPGIRRPLGPGPLRRRLRHPFHRGHGRPARCQRRPLRRRARRPLPPRSPLRHARRHRPRYPRDPVGDIRSIYEVTNPVADWREAADYYTRIFGLEPAHFCPIRSERYGYDGVLTLFDPPRRLDRIEITQTFGGGAMDRFFRRRGPRSTCATSKPTTSPCSKPGSTRSASPGARRGRPPGTNLFIHPKALFGMLVGVSKTNFAWLWSGRPDLSGAPADTPLIH
ncbi:hypothetical protein O0235_02630 [Tepidiforma flava]|uniref:VOC domain-containing protein n=1 Tax=Tepidiforma flava TaxID=3004094 RepID=A0ABY7M868_9CHLR|nr:hypothetical protein [Tepidiforma flava]WBL36482.1 hypothetical protein O0235_02630 [Tepidiforma flava]